MSCVVILDIRGFSGDWKAWYPSGWAPMAETVNFRATGAAEDTHVPWKTRK